MADADPRVTQWMKAFESLPDERKASVEGWFKVQALIIDRLGLTPESWFGYVAWAFEHPFDFSFANEFPDRTTTAAGDGADLPDGRARAQAFVGGSADRVAPRDGDAGPRKPPAGEGLDQDLFQQFLHSHLGGPGKKA